MGHWDAVQQIWTPDENQIKHANLTHFLNQHSLPSYEALLEKSVHDPEWFYRAVFDQFSFQWIKPFRSLITTDNGDDSAKWLTGGTTNVYINGITRHIAEGRGDRLAVIAENESGDIARLTYRDLKQQVDACAGGLKRLGVEKGDCVGIFLPFVPEVPVITYACAKIGAIVIPIFSGYGVQAVATRLTDSGAKILFTADGIKRNGKIVPVKEIADAACDTAATVERVIVLPVVNNACSLHPERDLLYKDLQTADQTPEVEPMNTDDPLMILYTSGTTGKPKGTVHNHVSFPVKSAIDQFFCFDLKPADRLFWLTDFGWMMGPWLIFGATLHGATVILYDGSPFTPNNERLFDVVRRHRVTVLGLAPTAVRTLAKRVDSPSPFPSLRILGSTGEAWDNSSWEWFMTQVGHGELPIINYSGGTEVSGGILGSFPTLPLKPSTFHGPIPGVSVEIAADSGEEDPEGTTGADVQGDALTGELTLNRPVLGMTQTFWNDHNRYVKTYWSKRPGVWSHGDRVQRNADGYWIMLGRTDDTLKVAGKRLGPAELEDILSSHSDVSEACVIGIPDELKGQVPVAFVVLKDSVPVHRQSAIKSELIELSSIQLGKALKPAYIVFLEEMPKTQSNKVPRRLIRMRFLGESITDTSAVLNPETLKKVPALKSLEKAPV